MRLTLIISLIFILSSFFPIIQIFLMYANGALIATVNKTLFGENLDKILITNWIVNFSLSLFFLILYFYAMTKSSKITYSIFFFLFSSSLICFLAYDYCGVEDPKPYFLYFLISSIVAGIILNIVQIARICNPCP